MLLKTFKGNAGNSFQSIRWVFVVLALSTGSSIADEGEGFFDEPSKFAGPLHGDYVQYETGNVVSSRHAAIVAVNELLERLPANLTLAGVVPATVFGHGAGEPGWEVAFVDKDSLEKKFVIYLGSTDGQVVQFCFKVDGVRQLICDTG